ncbi:MAG: hypothetical protein M9911_09815 [Saprospiraceae bacterium]|nr:hypothetical protein [Saprospiraceae bacterium]
MDRVFILNNVGNLPEEQLGESIIQGIVTMVELQETGDLSYKKRQAIDNYIRGVRQKEAENDKAAWEQARKLDTKESYRQYLTDYPSGQFFEDSNERISELEKFDADRDIIICQLKENPSSVSSDDIRMYLKQIPTFRRDLVEIGIPDKVIDKLIENPPLKSFDLGKAPDYIPDGFTEVYFWGVPGSGKTTALASILNTAEEYGLKLASSPGLDYMTQLKNIFDDKVPILPKRTDTDVIQYLPFTLKKSNEKNSRSVSLIELSGEVFECFYFHNAQKDMPSLQHKNTFETLLKFLDSNNPKLHFFFIDYEVSKRKDKYNRTQSDYLNAAASFLESEKGDILKKTEAIYIVVTKSDLISFKDSDKSVVINKYLQDNFTSLISSLQTKCKNKPTINNGNLLGVTFSLGKVYFDNICSFDNTSAKNIIDILFRRIQPSNKSLLNVFNN